MSEPERKIVTPLMHLLTMVSIDELLKFAQVINLRISLTIDSNQHSQCTIKTEGGFKCTALGRSGHSALADAMASFLAAEKRDYHKVQGDESL